jgi:hypothetical protein
MCVRVKSIAIWPLFRIKLTSVLPFNIFLWHVDYLIVRSLCCDFILFYFIVHLNLLRYINYFNITEMCKTVKQLNSAKRHSSIFSSHLLPLNQFIIVVNLVLVFYPSLICEYLFFLFLYKLLVNSIFRHSFIRQICFLSFILNLKLNIFCTQFYWN